MGKRDQLQELFEKVADTYEGTVEQKHVTDEYIDLRFLKDSADGPVEVGHVRLSFTGNVTISDQDGIERVNPLVKIVDHYGGQKIYVSNIPSAVIALSTR